MEKIKRKNDEALHIFDRSKMPTRFVISLIMAIVVFSFGFTVYDLPLNLLTVRYGVFSTVIVLAIFLISFRFNNSSALTSSIVIYEDGIEERIGSYRLFSSWENLSHFDQRMSEHGRYPVVGIVVFKALIDRTPNGDFEKRSRYKRNMFFINISDVVKVTGMQNQRIDRFQVDARFYYSELGQILREKAPHLIIQQK